MKFFKKLRFSIDFSTNVLINQLLLCLYTGGNFRPSLLSPPPHNSTKEKVKGEKFASSLRNPRKLEKWGKFNFPLRVSYGKPKSFLKNLISYLIFCSHAQSFASRFLNLFNIYKNFQL